MARSERFTFLCDTEERRAIVELATRLQRSQGGAVRYVVIQAVKQLSATEPTAIKALKGKDPKRGKRGFNAIS